MPVSLVFVDDVWLMRIFASAQKTGDQQSLRHAAYAAFILCLLLVLLASILPCCSAVCACIMLVIQRLVTHTVKVR